VIYPDFIGEGCTVAVTAPSDGNSKPIDYIRLDKAKHNLEQRGVSVIETPNVRTSIKGRSSAGEVRASEFMDVWKDDSISAVFAAKGGDFLMEMLSYLDFETIAKSPKWFQGYSDNTGLTFTITTLCDIASVYCNNFNDFAMKNWHLSVDNNWDLLCGKEVLQNGYDRYQSDFYDGTTGDEGYVLTTNTHCCCINRFEEPSATACVNESAVNMKGRLLGGCLDVLLNLVGTKYDNVKHFVEKYKNDKIIWYMESFSLSSESVERGLWQLAEAGWFDNVAGFIFGRPAFFESFTDTSFDEAVINGVGSFGVPIITGADIGHRPPQFTMINGVMCEFSLDGGQAHIKYDFV